MPATPERKARREHEMRRVAAALRAAGFEQGRPQPWEPTEGWVVEPYCDYVAAVRLINIVAKDGVAGQVREHRMLTAYAEALRSAGWRVVQDQVGFSIALIVSAPEDANS